MAAPTRRRPIRCCRTLPFIGGVGPGAHYYNPAAFAPVTTVGFGNSGLNILRNPGMWNTDLSIMRMFPIKERITLQFRAEFNNLAEHLALRTARPPAMASATAAAVWTTV